MSVICLLGNKGQMPKHPINTKAIAGTNLHATFMKGGNDTYERILSHSFFSSGNIFRRYFGCLHFHVENGC